jgi:hypothetical protein
MESVAGRADEGLAYRVGSRPVARTPRATSGCWVRPVDMGHVVLGADNRGRTSPALAGAIWCTVVLLVLIGVTATLARGLFPSDIVTRMEPVRQYLLDAFGIADPFAHQRPDELAAFDRRFAAHPVATLLHIVPGAIFLVLAPVQFISRVRDRHIRFHRWSGRVAILAAWVSGLAGLYFGLFMPYAGPGEAIAIALFGGLLLVAVSLGFVSIRRGRVGRHREWMIRAFALASAISTVRIVAAIMDIALTPAGFRPQQIFVISIWTGWILTVGVAELWITRTRRHVDGATTSRSESPRAATSGLRAARERASRRPRRSGAAQRP